MWELSSALAAGKFTIDNEGLSQSFGVVCLKNMKDSFACPGARILGIGTVFEVDKKGQRLYALRHHIDCPLQAVN